MRLATLQEYRLERNRNRDENGFKTIHALRTYIIYGVYSTVYTRLADRVVIISETYIH